MMTKKQIIAALLAVSLTLPSIAAQARGTDNQKKATLAGAAAGAALGGLLGNDGQSAIIGAVAGGLAGNAYAYHNKKMNQKDSEIAKRDRYREARRYRNSGYSRYDDYRYREARYQSRHGHRHHRHRDWDDGRYGYGY